jgi:hypothetical protein
MLRCPAFAKSWLHLESIVRPQIECVCPGMAIGCGGEAIAAGFEDRVDLVMRGKEALCRLGDLNRPMIFSRLRVSL